MEQWYTRHKVDNIIEDTLQDDGVQNDRDEGDDKQDDRNEGDGIQDETCMVDQNDPITDDRQWCYCKKGESYDYMIGCDGDNCPRMVPPTYLAYI